MSNKRKKSKDVYSERHIRRIIHQQTLNDLNEIHSRIFSEDNFVESSTNANTYCDGTHQICDSNVQLIDPPNFPSPNDSADHVDDLDTSNVAYYTSDIEQFSENEFESDTESQDDEDNNEYVVVEDIENVDVETGSFECTSEQRKEKLQKLCFWAQQFKIPLNAISSLLGILNELQMLLCLWMLVLYSVLHDLLILLSWGMGIIVILVLLLQYKKLLNVLKCSMSLMFYIYY